MRDEVEILIERLRAAQARLAQLPTEAATGRGPVDPATGEAWDRHNVLGHTAEFLPYWSAQLAAGVRGEHVGRPPGSSDRKEGIEGGARVGEAELRARIERGCRAAADFLTTLEDEDLDMELDTARGRQPLRQAIEYYLVGHLEQHVAQLAELPGERG